MPSNKIVRVVVFVFCATLATASFAQSLYIPDKLFSAIGPTYYDMFPTTITQTYSNPSPHTITTPPGAFFNSITPFPSSYSITESGMSGGAGSGDGGTFVRDEHLIRFATASENNTGHLFQRHEAFDMAFDMKLTTPNVAPRKEMGVYFTNATIGNEIFNIPSNDTFYTTGPGTIGTVFSGVVPSYSFSGSGPLGDYNLNGTVDAADYVVWRQTLGSTTDFRANGDNNGASEDLIDQADYTAWRAAFGQGSGGGLSYHVGDTVRLRMIYTPPVLSNPALPDVDNDPNVVTPGTMEYRISINGGAVMTSGPLAFDNSWQGIGNNTQIQLRMQNLGAANAPNDSATNTYSNFDFNGDAPGSGFGSAIGSSSVPEPTSLSLVGIGLFAGVSVRGTRRRAA